MSKVFVMKYALTAGIAEAEVIPRTTGESDLYTTVYNDQDLNGQTFLKNNECRPDRETALSAFEELKAKRIASLLKQVQALKKLEPTFIRWKKRELTMKSILELGYEAAEEVLAAALMDAP